MIIVRITGRTPGPKLHYCSNRVISTTGMAGRIEPREPRVSHFRATEFLTFLITIFAPRFILVHGARRNPSVRNVQISSVHGT